MFSAFRPSNLLDVRLLLLLSAGLVTSCIFGVDASNSNAGDDAETPEETGVDGGDGTADTDAGIDGSACESGSRKTWYIDEDDDGYGTEEQTMSACTRPSGFAENDGDCADEEPNIHPNASEQCDGIDQDCDGVGDASETNLAAKECSKQEGVCTGATIDQCTSDGESYADCGPDEYGSDYREADDESWRCEGADNDCDGETDEPCCGSNETPAATKVGSQGASETRPIIAPATDSASVDAAYAVAWSEGSMLRLRHVDESGSELATESKTFSDGTIAGIDLAASPDGYVAAVALDKGPGSPDSIRLHFFDETLLPRSTPKTPKLTFTGQGNELTNPSVAMVGSEAWVAYSFETGGDHTVEAAAADPSTGNIETEAFEISSDGLSHNPALPELAVVSGTPTAIWWVPGEAKLRGARLESAGAVQNRFRIAVTDPSSRTPEPVSTFVADGELGIVYTDYSTGSGALALRTVTPSATKSLSGGAPITTDSVANLAPSAVAVDPNRDATAERAVVAWQRGDGQNPTLLVGSTSIDSPSQMSERTLNDDFPSEPGLALRDGKLGASWLRVEILSDRKVRFAPVSIDAVPICAP